MAIPLAQSTLQSQSAKSLSGRLRVPGDKSISHRALILSALAEGQSEICNFLESEDCRATADALRSLGISIERAGQAQLVVEGKGLQGLQAANGASLNLGNSGTSMRLLSGVLAPQNFASHLWGDDSLNTRPMRRIQDPLQKMGADITTSEAGTAPIVISPCNGLKGIDYVMPFSSAQVKSCLLLAGIFAQGTTTITEPLLSRDHTERMLKAFGYPLRCNRNSVSIEGGGTLQATPIEVPGDISSAMFFIVAACITEQSDITLERVGINPTRTGALSILQRMGAAIEIIEHGEVNGEPVADIRVRSCELHGVDITAEEVPGAIDEFPVLFVAAACAKGTTSLRGAKELRVKESDRIATMTDGLARCGIKIKSFDDGALIEGGSLSGTTVDASNDHRVAMSFAIAGAVADSPMQVENSETIASSFPDFLKHAQQIGLHIRDC